MNPSTEKVLTYLAGNGNIDAVTVDDLQKLVAESPYFPVSQLLLAKKLKGENEAEYLLQAQKTALYFSNPYWLHFQLTEEQIQKEPDQQQTGSPIIEDQHKVSFAKTEAPAIEETPTVTAHFSTNELIAAGNITHQPLEKTTETDTIKEIDEIVESTNSVSNIEQTGSEEKLPANISQAEEEMAAIAKSPNEETENYISHLNTVSITTDHTDTSLPENLSPAAETEVVELEEEMAGVTHGSDNHTERFLEEIESGSNKEDLHQDDEHDRMFQNIKAMLDASSEEADADTKDAVVPIDPYYTIDYFASQGIKLELDQNPQDQLGQNLKKFTQWLRHMKKLGPEDATEVINRTETEADIQQIADSSNTVREVVTEAMATVLEKQGKKIKRLNYITN